MSAETGALYCGFETTPLLADMVAIQREAANTLPVPARLDIVLTGETRDPTFAANVAYAQRLREHGNTIGTKTNIHMPDPKSHTEALELILALNEDPQVDGIIPMLPASSENFDSRIRGSVDPCKDVDGVNPFSQFLPATPEAMVTVSEYMLREPLDYRSRLGGIAIIGNGNVVGKPLAKLLEQRRVPDITVYGREAIDAGLPGLSAHRVIFSAARKWGILTNENVSPGTVVIDAGFAINEYTGTPGGNAHPDLYQEENILTTAFRRGIGPITSAVVHDRTLHLATRHRETAALLPAAAIGQ